MYVAFAPWFSVACTQSYLAAADKGSAAFLFYVPSQATTAKPPSPNDEIWNLADGGRWKSQNEFPVYALSGANGAAIMQQLALYSGNLSQVKNGDLLAQQFNSRDYVRLYTNFGIGNDSNLPTLWAFLLIVLAVVLLLVGTTSFLMHYIQRRHRRDLRRRVENGEVDLETLGIKRQQLTQNQIDTLPLMPYVPNEKKPPLPLLATDLPSSPEITEAAPAVASLRDYNQPTCPICLEDYVPNETSVRSLPCHHIYHPGCIDPFLLSNSSLCPVCKAKVNLSRSAPITAVTPCPRITNSMVRRERYARRLRERAEQSNSSREGVHRWESFRRHCLPLPSRSRPRQRNSRAPALGDQHPAGTWPESMWITMGVLPPNGLSNPLNHAPPSITATAAVYPVLTTPTTQATPTTTVSPPPAAATARHQPPQDPETRREWARRRASALLGRGGGASGDGIVDVDEEEQRRRAQMPKCELPSCTPT